MTWRQADALSLPFDDGSFDAVGCQFGVRRRCSPIGIVQGSPLRNEIEARDASLLGRATDVVEAAIAAQTGTGAVDGKMQAVIVSVER